MQIIYEIYQDKLCVKKSFLKSYLMITDDLIGEIDVIRQRHYSLSALIELKKLPLCLRTLIKEVFGEYHKPKRRPVYNKEVIMLSRVYIRQLKALNKEIELLKNK